MLVQKLGDNVVDSGLSLKPLSHSSRLWGTWVTNLVDNPLSIKLCPLTVTSLTRFPKGMLPPALRARDILEWEQGCYPLREDLFFSLRVISFLQNNTLERERDRQSFFPFFFSKTYVFCMFFVSIFWIFFS